MIGFKDIPIIEKEQKELESKKKDQSITRRPSIGRDSVDSEKSSPQEPLEKDKKEKHSKSKRRRKKKSTAKGDTEKGKTQILHVKTMKKLCHTILPKELSKIELSKEEDSYELCGKMIDTIYRVFGETELPFDEKDKYTGFVSKFSSIRNRPMGFLSKRVIQRIVSILGKLDEKKAFEIIKSNIDSFINKAPLCSSYLLIQIALSLPRSHSLVVSTREYLKKTLKKVYISKESHVFAISLLGSYLGCNFVVPILLEYCSHPQNPSECIFTALMCALGLCRKGSSWEDSHSTIYASEVFIPALIRQMFYLVDQRRKPSPISTLAVSLISSAWPNAYNHVETVELYISAHSCGFPLGVMQGTAAAFHVLMSISHSHEAYTLLQKAAASNVNLLENFSKSLHHIISGKVLKGHELQIVKMTIVETLPGICDKMRNREDSKTKDLLIQCVSMSKIKPNIFIRIYSTSKLLLKYVVMLLVALIALVILGIIPRSYVSKLFEMIHKLISSGDAGPIDPVDVINEH
ncbi:hypothetical protein ADUPG1_009134 [Aduncisulcus paluster]|uniref:Uncharacterized protein n=1 Tax=Aduncisulcus paluster TaxID=2918883 RepID=A0ABQ5KUG3_9EUKA|nr:hypothetical protein ADUPG1_009134 [Aduncisulcus paluster]